MVTFTLLSGCQQVMERLANDLGIQSTKPGVTQASDLAVSKPEAIEKPAAKTESKTVPEFVPEPAPTADISGGSKDISGSPNLDLAARKTADEKKRLRPASVPQKPSALQQSSPLQKPTPLQKSPAKNQPLPQQKQTPVTEAGTRDVPPNSANRVRVYIED